MNYAMPQYRYSPDPYRQALYGLSNESIGTMNNIDPSLGYQYFLQHQPRMSFGHDTAMKRLFDTFKTRYSTDVASDPAGKSGLMWTDWLKDLDVNYELARMPSSFRSEQNRYGRPARWVNF
jgi:hypothetical protein